MYLIHLYCILQLCLNYIKCVIFREEQPVEQIKPPSIFDHNEMKEEYYDSYHAQKNPDAYIDNSAYE